jgi:hypothetical protein
LIAFGRHGVSLANTLSGGKKRKEKGIGYTVESTSKSDANRHLAVI